MGSIEQMGPIAWRGRCDQSGRGGQGHPGRSGGVAHMYMALSEQPVGVVIMSIVGAKVMDWPIYRTLQYYSKQFNYT